MRAFSYILSAVLGWLILYVADTFFPGAEGFLMFPAECAVFLGVITPVAFGFVRHKSLFRSNRIEYISDGHGETTEKKFEIENYPGYRRESADKNGALYANDSGVFIMTRFAPESGESPFLLIMECVTVALLCALIFRIFRRFPDNAFRSLTHALSRIETRTRDFERVLAQRASYPRTDAPLNRIRLNWSRLPFRELAYRITRGPDLFRGFAGFTG